MIAKTKTPELPRSSASSKWHATDLVPVVLLLLLMGALRLHDITGLYAFIDEGYHNERAAIVWHFTVNPGQFSNGKFLVYYWLGLFSGPPMTNLYTNRTAIALFSLLTGAFVYMFGRRLHRPETGLLALVLYAISPMAVFHERMALADPFAAVFACLVVWRSLVFGRRPSIREGAIIGALLALATMAKLTLGLMPLLPVIATIIYFPELNKSLVGQIRYWMGHYLPPLIIAALVTVILWLPILIPAVLAHNTPNEFVLLDAQNVAQTTAAQSSLPRFIIDSWNAVAELASAPFLIAALMALLIIPALSTNRLRLFQSSALLLSWFVATTVLTLGLAGFTNSRYFVPSFVPLVVILAIGAIELWRLAARASNLWVTRVVRGTLIGAGVLWLISFALPFDLTLAIDSGSLVSNTPSGQVYSHGGFMGDTPRQSVITAQIPVDARIVYGDNTLCHLLNFYSAVPITCLPKNNNFSDVKSFALNQLRPGETAYVMAMFPLTDEATAGFCPVRSQRYLREQGSTYATLWEIQRPPCSSQN